jgi:hypothetical protein
MAGSTTKKAIVERFEKGSLPAYINPVSFLGPAGIEVLSVEGQFALLPYAEIKTVAFVRDFDATGTTPSGAGRRVFLTRPKMDGLWVRLRFRDNDVMEGVMPNNLLQVEQYGFTVVPPDSYGNRQRVFIPRQALRSVEVLGVVGSPLTKRKAKPALEEQIRLFDE